MPSIISSLTELANSVCFAFNPQRSEVYQMTLEDKTVEERVQIMLEVNEIEKERIRLDSEIARSPYRGYDPLLSIKASELMRRAADIMPGLELGNKWSRVRGAVIGNSRSRWMRLSTDAIALEKRGVQIFGGVEQFQDTLVQYWRLLAYGIEFEEKMLFATPDDAWLEIYDQHPELNDYTEEYVKESLNKALNILKHVRCFLAVICPKIKSEVEAEGTRQNAAEDIIKLFVDRKELWTTFILYYMVRVAETGATVDDVFCVPVIQSKGATFVHDVAWILEPISALDVANKMCKKHPVSKRPWHLGCSIKAMSMTPTY